jgi:acyl dehydratase
MKVDVLRSWRFKDIHRTYGDPETILYALGIGLGARYTDPDELRFVTERDLCALPTMNAVVAKLEVRQCLQAAEVDTVEAFHGEQRSVFDRVLPGRGSVVGKGRVLNIWDKGPGRGTLIDFEQEVFDAESGERYCLLRSLVFCRRDGGYGGDPGGPAKLPPVPDGPPDTIFDFPTLPQASLIYRQSGDRNPLHSDPEVARQAGFPRPILHGYLSYGVAGWAIMRSYLDCHPGRLAALDCRFAAPAFPGETLRTEMWRSGNEVHYQVRALERDVIAISNGRALLRG